jgi:hypothetical protein
MNRVWNVPRKTPRTLSPDSCGFEHNPRYNTATIATATEPLSGGHWAGLIKCAHQQLYKLFISALLVIDLFGDSYQKDEARQNVNRRARPVRAPTAVCLTIRDPRPRSAERLLSSSFVCWMRIAGIDWYSSDCALEHRTSQCKVAAQRCSLFTRPVRTSVPCAVLRCIVLLLHTRGTWPTDNRIGHIAAHSHKCVPCCGQRSVAIALLRLSPCCGQRSVAIALLRLSPCCGQRSVAIALLRLSPCCGQRSVAIALLHLSPGAPPTDDRSGRSARRPTCSLPTT